MNTIDIIILIFLLVGAYSGFRKGFLREVLSLAAFFAAVIIGIRFMDSVIKWLIQHIEGYDFLLPALAFSLIFVGILVLLHFLGKAIKKVLDMTPLGSFDNLAGSLLGAFKWALLMSVLLWIFESLGGYISPAAIESSLLYAPVAAFAPGLLHFFSGLSPYFMEWFERSQEWLTPQEYKT